MAIQVPPRALFVSIFGLLLLLLVYYSQFSMNAMKGVEELTEITQINEMMKWGIQNPYRIRYKTVGALDIPADVWLPDPKFIKRHRAPVLFMIHGGAWIVGKSDSMSEDQIKDSLERGWIVLSLEHRLCPGVTLREGPMRDVRDALKWVQTGGLQKALSRRGFGNIRPDPERTMAMGASAGAHLALTMVGMPRAVVSVWLIDTGIRCTQKALGDIGFLRLRAFQGSVLGRQCRPIAEQPQRLRRFLQAIMERKRSHQANCGRSPKYARQSTGQRCDLAQGNSARW